MRRVATTVAVMLVGALIALPHAVLATGPTANPVPPGPISTSLPDGITLSAPSVIKAGREIDVDATFAAGGFLRAGAGLHFIIDDVERRMVRTDASGVAHFRLRGVLASGVHHLEVSYAGTKQYFYSEPARATATFEVSPLIITVQTVPAMPGVTLMLDGGKGLVSNAAGEVMLGVARAGLHRLAVTVPAPTETSRVSFVRWSDDSWQPSRVIRVIKDVTISVGLRAAYLTPIQFVGLDNNPLDPTLVSDVVISGPNAEVIQLQYPYDPIWLQTPMPAKHSGEAGLHVTSAPYSLSFARYTRLNVASTGQMRFAPAPGSSWAIKLLLFTLRLGAKDAIFGTTLYNSIRLIGPTGRAQMLSLGDQNRITLVLSRGNYSAQVQASGVTPVATIALSRSQEVVIPVITPIDLFTIGLILIVIVATVFVAGRGRFWAVSSLAAARVQYGAPIIQQWERQAPRRRVVQNVAAAVAERLNRPVLPGVPWKRRSVGLVAAQDVLVSQQALVAWRAISSFPRSCLLGHETGHGPTIEVGLILRGLIDSGKAERFLLLVHQSVMTKWQRELKEKFSISMPRFERNSFLDCDDRELEWSGNPWSAFPLVLASSDLARRRDRRSELLAAGPWDVVLVDNAEEAHRSGSTPTGASNKLLGVLQAMNASHSWKALYLTSAAPPQLQLHEASDLMELLGFTQLPAEVESDLARYYAIPRAQRPDGDWEFLRQMCTDYVGDDSPPRPSRAALKPRRSHNVAGSREARRAAAKGARASLSVDPAQERLISRL
jgi:SNF2 domain-containing protein